VSDIDWDALHEAAVAVMARGLRAVLDFKVGAAGSSTTGGSWSGCNVENAAYGVALCAECGMVSALHAGGGGRLVAVVCVDAAERR
jgi:cytidine deaminase